MKLKQAVTDTQHVDTLVPPISSASARYGLVMLQFARACALGVAVVLPFSTAATNVFASLCLLAWLASGQLRTQARIIAANPVAVGALVIYLVLWAGVIWTSAPLEHAATAIHKYRKFLLLPVILALLSDSIWRVRVLVAFAASCVVLLVASYGVYLGFPGLPSMTPGQGAIVMRSHIAQSFLMALLALGGGFALFCASRPWQRGLGGLIAVAALIDMLVLIQGRTGYVILVALLTWLAWKLCSWRGRIGTLAAIAVLAVGVYTLVPTVQMRTDAVMTDLQRYQDGDANTSAGLRLHFYARAMAIMAEAPLFGAGTGAWKIEYDEREQASDLTPPQSGSGNPHNDFLLLGVQLGGVGLLLYVFALALAYRLAQRLPRGYEWGAQGVLVAYFAGALFNSFMWDSTEGMVVVLLLATFFSAFPQPVQAVARDD